MSDELRLAIDLLESDASSNELLIGIGDNIPDTFSFDELSAEAKIDSGRAWWNAHAPEIKIIICGVVNNRDFVNAGLKDLLQIAFAAIGAKFGMGIAAYAAALGMRMVAEGWCGKQTNGKSPIV